AKSELGKETLEIAAKAGYTVGFVDTLFCFGSCNDIKKTINLNPMFSDDKLVGTLAHEARHAGQFSRGASTSAVGNISVKSQIMLDRAMEADAQRTACIATWELKQKGDENAYKEFALKYPLITNSFEKAVKKGENADTAVFKGWYDDDKMKSIYEDTYRYQVEYEMDDDTMFRKEYTSKEIVADICFTKDGKGYFTDSHKILEQGKFLDVEQETMDFLQKFMKERKERDGFTPDKSIDELPIRSDASIADTQKNTAVIMAKAQKGR
ncbi:MAG: hypothetical protein KAJ75_04800, partial [Alphaproteobacteria bacterium]|nr:hypothetical protein [Alphaproteobacteria bacterium]